MNFASRNAPPDDELDDYEHCPFCARLVHAGECQHDLHDPEDLWIDIGGEA